MSKIRNTGITDKWGLRHTRYVATATHSLKTSTILVYGNVHILWIYQEAKKKILAFK